MRLHVFCHRKKQQQQPNLQQKKEEKLNRGIKREHTDTNMKLKKANMNGRGCTLILICNCNRKMITMCA